MGVVVVVEAAAAEESGFRKSAARNFSNDALGESQKKGGEAYVRVRCNARGIRVGFELIFCSAA